MRIDFLTLFPEMCERVMSESIIGRATAKGLLDFHYFQIRDYTENRQKQVDDAPYGGGMGMIMQAQPIYDCYLDALKDCDEKPHVIFMSPRGKVFTQERAKELAKMPRLMFICGHYEGVDQRVLDEIQPEEISIGDYVLTGGELPAMVVADSVCRLVPGVLSDETCFTEESHYNGLLEYPQYSRPRVWMDREVPEILLSGHHANIEKWRREESLKITKECRPDMLERAELSKKDKQFLKSLDEIKIEE